MRVILWLLRAFLFFVLFAFALNNQHEARLKWFFGYEWRAPMVIIVLGVFALGCVLGLLGHLPGWVRTWRQGRPGGAAGVETAERPLAPSGTAEAGHPQGRRGRGTASPVVEPAPLIEPPRDAL